MQKQKLSPTPMDADRNAVIQPALPIKTLKQSIKNRLWCTASNVLGPVLFTPPDIVVGGLRVYRD